jgi:D-3-phosphoglycerate dehydrogenase
MRILNTIGSDFTPQAKAILEKVAVVDYKILSQNELEKVIDEYDGVLIGLGLVFSNNVLEKARRLKVIATATTGLDHIDIESAKQRGIDVLSLRGEEEFLNTITGTAELAFGLLLDLSRFIPWSFEAVKRGEWRREEYRGHSLAGKTLGIVGMGRLGRIMAWQATGFGMKVIYNDPKDPIFFYNDYQSQEYKKVSLDELLEQSDAVSIHAHLSNETENMFGTREFELMKNSAYLINTSRGKIVDEAALLKALERGDIAGYACDVMADALAFEQSGKAAHPLIEYAKNHRNVLIVPHTGGMTVESREATDIFIARKLANFLTT